MARTPTANASSGRSTFKTVLKGLAYAALVGVLALGVAVAVATAYLPSYSDLTKRSDLGQMIRVHAANGQVLVSIGPSFGKWLPYDQIPAEMRAALISTEDRRFRSHIGIDPIGLVRAVGSALIEGHRVRATSTITQQLARNIFLTNKRDYARKVKEAILALALERKFSKDQILELYLNREYFGGGAYGIDAASRKFFGHGAAQLSLGEAAIMAGLVKAPSNYSRLQTLRLQGRARAWSCRPWPGTGSSARRWRPLRTPPRSEFNKPPATTASDISRTGRFPSWTS